MLLSYKGVGAELPPRRDRRPAVHREIAVQIQTLEVIYFTPFTIDLFGAEVLVPVQRDGRRRLVIYGVRRVAHDDAAAVDRDVVRVERDVAPRVVFKNQRAAHHQAVDDGRVLVDGHGPVVPDGPLPVVAGHVYARVVRHVPVREVLIRIAGRPLEAARAAAPAHGQRHGAALRPAERRLDLQRRVAGHEEGHRTDVRHVIRNQAHGVPPVPGALGLVRPGHAVGLVARRPLVPVEVEEAVPRLVELRDVEPAVLEDQSVRAIH